jgi:PadR family transcriptional regulator, regulatory protein PadR
MERTPRLVWRNPTQGGPLHLRPAWGLRLCQVTGHGTGTIYPALDRLLKAGLINDYWEDPQPTDRPRRRFYEITSTGRERYAAALRARDERRAAWLRPSPQPGTSL